MKKFLNSTATVAVCLSMSLPGPAFAQSAEVADCAPKKKDRSFPCLTEEGVIAQDAKSFRQLRKAARKDGDIAAEGEAVEGIAEADDAPPATAAPAEAAAAEVPAVSGDETAPAQASQSDDAASEQPAAVEVAEDAAPVADEGTAPAVDTESTTAVDETPSEVTEEVVTETTAVSEEKPDETVVQTEETTPSAETSTNAANQSAEAVDTIPADAPVVPNSETVQAPTADAAPAAAAAAAIQASTDASVTADVDVSTEEVTAENTRSSSEEFATSADGTPASAATAAAPSNDDDGLSNFEKALLLGLGAVVVGKVLDNGDEVVSRSGDRVVVERDGELRVLKNDDTLLRQPGSNLRTETFNDGSTRTTVNRQDGSQIVTIRAADGRVLSRTRITPEGEAIVIFDDTAPEPNIDVAELPPINFQQAQRSSSEDEDALTRALQAELGRQPAGFSLRQIREIKQVRALAPEIELTNIQFETGSAAIRPAQARSLARIGTTITDIIEADPRSVVLIEGHTDAVGGAAYNLALSDRRAETVALALTEYFDVPPENLIVQGYGESALKVPTNTAEPANRRAVVRNITPLLR